MIILQLSDFIKGKYNIPAASALVSATNTEVQCCIDDNEKKYIYLLLGVELGDLIIAYIAAGSTGNADYDKIIAPFSETSVFFCGQFKQSLGIKKYLQACIYYEYTKDSYTETLAGTVKKKGEVSDSVSASATMRKAEKAFNGILYTAEAIQSVCASNSTAYAGYAGSRVTVNGHQFFI